MAIFRPKEKLKIFTDFDSVRLKNAGFDTVLLDIDNTIAVPDTGVCDERAASFIQKLKKEGFRVVIFSNNTEERVLKFLNGLDCEFVHHAFKPLPFKYWTAAKRFNTRTSRMIILGDQLLTDILGANLSGVYGIYCKQLKEKDSTLTAINRRFEKLIWRYILHDEV